MSVARAGSCAVIALGFALGLAPSASVHAASADFRCLKSGDAKKPIQLQFDFPATKQAMGWITYRKGSGRIAVRRIRAEQTDSPPDRPAEFTTTWKEVGAAGAGGTYTMVSQGARIYGFSYRGAHGGKPVEFEEDLGSTGDAACSWKRG